MHRDAGHVSPTDHSVVRRVMDGVSREQAITGRRALQSLPMTPTLIDVIAARADMNNTDHAMIVTAMHVGTAGLMRVGEFTTGERTLRVRDVHRVGDGYRIVVNMSKTDQHGRGQSVYVGNPRAVQLLKELLKRHTRSDAMLFTYEDGSPLTRTKLLRQCRKWMTNIPLPPHRGISFRAGGATALHEAGTKPDEIKALGRWRSNAYQRYIRLNQSQLLVAASRSSLSSPRYQYG